LRQDFSLRIDEGSHFAGRFNDGRFECFHIGCLNPRSREAVPQWEGEQFVTRPVL
jgi:hypothetical protein